MWERCRERTERWVRAVAVAMVVASFGFDILAPICHLTSAKQPVRLA
jgi:hypothetical protein